MCILEKCYTESSHCWVGQLGSTINSVVVDKWTSLVIFDISFYRRDICRVHSFAAVWLVVLALATLTRTSWRTSLGTSLLIVVGWYSCSNLFQGQQASPIKSYKLGHQKSTIHKLGYFILPVWEKTNVNKRTEIYFPTYFYKVYYIIFL